MEPDQQLSHRLAMVPSPWGVVAGRRALTLAVNGFLAMFVVRGRSHVDEVPLFAKVVVTLWGFIGLGMVWDLVVRAYRTAVGRFAVLELDRLPLRPGAKAHGRVLLRDPATLSGLTVSLVGERHETRTDEGRVQVIAARFHESVVFTFDPASDPETGPMLDRRFAVPVPGELPPGTLTWRLVVALRLKQGGMDSQDFPLQVAS